MYLIVKAVLHGVVKVSSVDMTVQKLPPSGTTIPTGQLTVLTTGCQTAYTKPPHLPKYMHTFSLNSA